MKDGGDIARRRRRQGVAAGMKSFGKFLSDFRKKRIRRKSLQQIRMRKAEAEAEGEPLISILNYDLLLEVFIRLPDSQSTMRCGLVCKHWFSVISSIDFQTKKIQQHLYITNTYRNITRNL